MSETLDPTNANTSFTQLMTDQDKQLADASLKPALKLLLQAGISREKLADILFGYVKSLSVPEGKLDASTATIWYAQLQRFRNDISAHIDQIETALDATE